MTAVPPGEPGALGDAWPDVAPLGGTDHLLAAIDARMRRRSGEGLVCHLLLELEDGDAATGVAEAVAAALAASAGWAWLTSLRLGGRPPWSRLAWRRTDAAPPPLGRFRVAGADDLPAALPASIDPRREAVVRLAVGLVGDRPAVAMSWHHAALDARAAEAWLLAWLGGGACPVAAGAGSPAPTGWGARLWEAKRGRDALLRESIGGVRFWPRGAGRTRRARRTLPAADGSTVAARVAALGAGPFRSLAFLAVAAGAIASRHPEHRGDLLVPMPQDPRRGDAVAGVGNAIRMLILRAPGSAVGDPRALVAALTERLRDAVRAKLPAAVEALLDACRWLPGWALLAVALLPTWGRMATLGFSDAGDTLDRFVAVGGRRVRHARHFPAALNPPGLTVVFSSFRGELAVDLLWQDGALAEGDARAILDAVAAALAGPEGGP